MTLSQLALIIGVTGGSMCLLDWILSKVKKDWKPLPWEENENECQ